MKYSALWALILLVLWVVPGCCATESRHSATIVIGEGNSLLFKKAGQDELVVIFEAGDTVLVEWENDTCYVNGQVHWPPPPVSPTVYPVAMLRELYGRVPSVVQYVDAHSGDETEVWNEAVRYWERQTRALAREVTRQYTADIESGKTSDEAAEAVVEMLRASPLADSPRVDETRRQADSTTRIIEFRWAGRSVETTFMLTPVVELDLPFLPPRMTQEEFESFVRTLQRLEREGPATVELKGGNVLYITGPMAKERMRVR